MHASSLSRRLAALLSILAWLVMAHPYEGLRHDGVLYLGQALLHSTAPQLSQDVFFSSGSQDRYSIYAHLMVPLYEHLGRLTTHIALLTISWLLMLGGVAALLRRFEASWQSIGWGLLAFAVMSPIYGGSWVFGYCEAFITARSFAEPLLLWSLVTLLDGRPLATGALQVVAALFHPLMALPVMSLSWCYLVQADRRWLWLLAAVPLALVAAATGAPPWNGLLKTYDPYWWSVFETGSHHLLLENWTLEDHLMVVLDLAILLTVTRIRPSDAWTRLVLAAVTTTAALIGLTAIGADVFHSVLLTQLQLWRAHWISHLLAMALAPWLIAQLWRLNGLWRASACALGLALLNFHIGMDHGVPTLLLWAVTSLAASRIRHASRPTVWLSCAGILLCIIGLSAYQLDGLLQLQGWKSQSAEWGARFIKVAAFPTVAVAGFAALLCISHRHRVGAWLAVPLSALLLFGALANWDQRSDFARVVESSSGADHPFVAHVPANASVYWAHQLVPTWGLLGRISHFSQQQGAGVVFNRHTALIFGPRKESYRLIGEDRERCINGALLSRDRIALAQCEMPAQARLATLCSQPDSPDFLVLPDQLKLQPLATWQPPARRDLPSTFALYACSQLTALEN
ncbi:hypothetical protein J2X20_003229 [Pelomonas saccharophila]|uniref:Uncharacterized protein n=1 Tax=Roseateles saccharophilus TaxID=304 RepID=A0ABU1YNY4_ROSSA|nr:hypothetical protein [Roseateles saccharophilus]MDR7270571.1 hypothetical protein [Roseateles saccharophilus]